MTFVFVIRRFLPTSMLCIIPTSFPFICHLFIRGIIPKSPRRSKLRAVSIHCAHSVASASSETTSSMRICERSTKIASYANETTSGINSKSIFSLLLRTRLINPCPSFLNYESLVCSRYPQNSAVILYVPRKNISTTPINPVPNPNVLLANLSSSTRLLI